MKKFAILLIFISSCSHENSTEKLTYQLLEREFKINHLNVLVEKHRDPSDKTPLDFFEKEIYPILNSDASRDHVFMSLTFFGRFTNLCIFLDKFPEVYLKIRFIYDSPQASCFLNKDGKFSLNKSMIRLAKMKNLETLIISNSSSSEEISIPSSIGELTKITKLSLNKSGIKSLPSSIGNLSELKFLSLASNKISSLPKNFENLKNLEFLNLSENHLKSFPTEIKNFKKLTKLDLSFNKLPQIPDFLSEFTKLSSLSLNNNNLKSLTDLFQKLTDLEYLLLNNNDLLELPTSIKNLSRLISLNVSNNKNLKLPKDFFKNLNLKQFLYQNTQIDSKEVPKKLREIF